MWCALALLMAVPQDVSDLRWVAATELTVEGQGWRRDELAAPYDRLPARAEESVRPPVWQLSRDSSGLVVRFRTRSPQVRVRYRLRRSALAMSHMPATGVSGLDLYARAGDRGWRWLAVVRPETRAVDVVLVDGLGEADALREFALYLPLYNGVEQLELAVPAAYELVAAPRRERAPIVFYGTSITQGACASRPGLAHVARVGRHFDWPTVNLGFSGNGRLEPEIGVLLAEIEAAAYVIDCLPNVDDAQVRARLGPLVRALRTARPRTPIVLVQDRVFDDAWLREGRRRRNDANHAAFDEVVERLRAEGVTGVHVVAAAALLGDDGEATVDGSHPNDIGFARHAAAFVPVLQKCLPSREKASPGEHRRRQ